MVGQRGKMSDPKVLPEERQFEIAMHLHEQGMFGVHENPSDFITLKSGRVSPHYLNTRPGISSSETRQLIGSALLDLATINGDEGGFDHIAGTPEAFTSYAATMADISGYSLLQPRVAKKDSGNKTPILGSFHEGDSVAIFDDVVTDGNTKIDSIAGLRDAGLSIAGYFVVMDRQEGGAPQVLEATGISIQSVLRVADMVRLLRAENVYSSTQFNNVKEYLEQYGDRDARASLGTV